MHSRGHRNNEDSGLQSDNMRQMAAEAAALISAKNKEIVIHKKYPPACFQTFELELPKLECLEVGMKYEN